MGVQRAGLGGSEEGGELGRGGTDYEVGVVGLVKFDADRPRPSGGRGGWSKNQGAVSIGSSARRVGVSDFPGV
ncbi:hypothetical protein GCM10009639_03510 [Kitasatospora putterlickiae]|uniref:Uncharacterized protein n=1 Tax=Kitasatospora putterlickiae TaxID=221725 RepID=A0ABP4I747_9ACTN